jgi:predicted TPR repeat methyltransferase
MNNLYTELASVYEAMYQTFIDYKEEYHFYSEILKKYNKKEVVEIGCGTGNLAGYFLDEKYNYTGLDLSEEMINLAKEKSNGRFIKADMRDFKLQKTVESIIITARTISYLLTNQDLNAAFRSISDNIEKGGILAFDIIDANRFVPMMAKDENVEHQATFNSTNYIRKSTWKLQLTHGIDFLWDAIYYKEDNNELIEIGQDHSNVRAFTVNEMEIFLFANGFQLKEVIDRPSYFFPTYVFVAEKI